MFARRTVEAPNVDGYRFVCWIGCSASGFAPSVVFYDYSAKITDIYLAALSSPDGQTGTVYPYALYERVSFDI